jgi:hypothetical protein
MAEPDFTPAGWHCYRKPNRKRERLVDAKAAARFVCEALEHGYTMNEIMLHVKERCDGKCSDVECEEELEKIRKFLELLAGALAYILAQLLLARGLGLKFALWALRLFPRRVLDLLGATRLLERLEALGPALDEATREVRRMLELIRKSGG